MKTKLPHLIFFISAIFIFSSSCKKVCVICSYSSDVDGSIVKSADGCGKDRTAAEEDAQKALGDQPNNAALVCY